MCQHLLLPIWQQNSNRREYKNDTVCMCVCVYACALGGGGVINTQVVVEADSSEPGEVNPP